MTPRKRHGRARHAPERTPVEWVTFAVACTILAVVAVLVGLRLGDDQRPARPTAVVDGPARPVPGGHEITVEVRNHGERTAQDIQVRAELTIHGDTAEIDQQVMFLAGDEAEDLRFVFEDDPAQGELTIRVTGYATP